jgi:hypothetical protein
MKSLCFVALLLQVCSTDVFASVSDQTSELEGRRNASNEAYKNGERNVFGRSRTLVLNLSQFDSVFHLHVPKTAGSTFQETSDFFLPRNLSSKCFETGVNQLPQAQACSKILATKLHPELVSIAAPEHFPSQEILLASRHHRRLGRQQRPMVECSKCRFIDCECPMTLVRLNVNLDHTLLIFVVRNPLQHFISFMNHYKFGNISQVLDPSNKKNTDRVNMQTKFLGPTLPEALSALENEAHLVGITEEFSSSVCLFMYRLSVFTKSSLKGSDCDCEVSHQELPFLDNRQRLATKESATVWSMNPREITTINSELMDDYEVYGLALHIFRKQVTAVEAESGAKVLCTARNS